MARRVARVALVSSLLRGAGIGLSAGLALSLLLIGADRVWAFADLRLLVAGPALLGVAGGLAWGASRAWSLIRAAQEVDAALDLRDALSSAIEFADSAHARNDEAFVSWATSDAERAAGAIRVRRVVRVRPGWSWVAWPVVGAMAVAMGLFVPRVERAPTEAQLGAQRTAERDSLQAKLTEVQTAASDALQSSAGDAATSDELSALEDLKRELQDDGADPKEIAAKAAGELERLADTLEREADVTARESDALREQLSATDLQSDGATSALADALGAGDMNAAREAARELLEQVPTMDDAERQRLAEDLSRLADQLAARAPERSSDATRDELRRQGLDDEQIDRLEQEKDPQEAARQLEQQGVNPDVARRLAERTSDDARRREAEQRADEQRRDLNDALRETAHDLDPNQPKPEPRQATDSEQDDQRSNESTAPESREQQKPSDQPSADSEGQQPDQQQSGEERSDEERSGDREQGDQKQGDQQSGDQRSDAQKPGEQKPGEQKSGDPGDQKPGDEKQTPSKARPGDQPAQGPAREGTEAKDGDPQSSEGEQTTESPGNEASPSDNAKPGDQQGPGEKQGAGDQPGAGEQPGSPNQPGQQSGEGAEPGQGSEPGDARQPAAGAGTDGQPTPVGQPGQGARPGGSGDTSQDPNATQPGAGSQPGTSERTRDLYQQLERMAQRQQQGAQQAKKAEELRRHAQQLMENASPEQRQRMQELAEQLAAQDAQGPALPPAPFDPEATELMDARPTGSEQAPAPEQVIAQWFGDGQPGDEHRVGHAGLAEHLQEAAAGAEQAIEQQQVPRRHRDLLRRVFKRYADEAESAPKLEDAKDAGGS